MKKTMRFERMLKAANEDAREVMTWYETELKLQRVRRNATGNSFIKTCCQQEIDQLTAEKEAIEAEVLG